MADECFIKYSLAVRVLARMHELTMQIGRLRPEGMLIVGDSNNGKSHLLRRFCSELPVLAGKAGLTSVIPAIYLQAPVNANRRDFFSSMASALGIPDASRLTAQRVRQRTLDAMETAKTMALCVDELHHIAPGGPARQRVFIDDLKYISNELKIPVFLAGTSLSFALIAKDEQYSDRFKPVMLPRWDLNKEFLWLLASIERVLGVEQGDLTNPSHAKLFWLHSRGLIGRIWSICELANRKARLTESGRITEAIINAAGYTDLPWKGPDFERSA